MKAIFHRLTPFFTRSIYDRLTVANNSGRFNEKIQQIEAGKYPKIQKNVEIFGDCYENFPSMPSNKIMKILEYHGLSHFKELNNHGVQVSVYKKGDPLDTFSQNEPDNTFNFKKSSFADKRVHDMDHKAVDNSREFENRIFSQISIANYRQMLKCMENQIIENTLELTVHQLANIRNALKELAASCNDIKIHQIVWAQQVHHFPNAHIPPIRINQTIAFDDMIPEIKKNV